MTVFAGEKNLTKQDKSRLEKIIKKGGGIVGKKLDSFDTLNEKRVAKKLNNIHRDDTIHSRRNSTAD